MKNRTYCLILMICLVLAVAAGCDRFALSPKVPDVSAILEQTKAQLSPAELAELADNWKEAGKVQTMKVEISTGLFIVEGIHETGQFVVPAEFIDKDVWIVTLPSIQRELVGDIQRVVDPLTGKLIGYSLRD